MTESVPDPDSPDPASSDHVGCSGRASWPGHGPQGCDHDRTLPTRDQRRSLWMNYAVAAKLAADPDRVLAHARANLARYRVQVPRAWPWHDQWQRLLDGPVDAVLAALVSRTELSLDLRQNTPFAGILTEDERAALLVAFRTHDVT